MAKWNGNNLACATTWTTLRVLDQSREVFPNSGNIKMSELTYWNQLATSEARQLQATSLANQIDNVFRDIEGAKYEAGASRQTAVDTMVLVLTDEEKSMTDLAEVIDAIYCFWGEK